MSEYDWIDEKVAEIKSAAGDPEAAHSMTDRLYVDVLQKISQGVFTSAIEAAFRTLKAEEIDFPRWCA